METIAGDERGNRARLIGADLDRRKSAIVEYSRELRRQRAIGVQALATGEQRLIGLKLAHARPEIRVVRDVGRIAEDEVEVLGQPLRPIALHKLCPAFEAE